MKLLQSQNVKRNIVKQLDPSQPAVLINKDTKEEITSL
jgi:hypothetical protein